MKNGLELDYETADRITLLNLEDQKKYLIKELEDYKEGKWLHPDDVIKNGEIIRAMELLIPYYGGTNE
jgi:hypothetical protein